MTATEISIAEHDLSDTSDVLELLLQLHENYFKKNAPKQIREINEEKDIKRSYQEYLNSLCENKNTWKTFIAVNTSNQTIGLIIGSITNDESIVQNKIGKIEDWYVEDVYRGKGIGIKLYNALEKWFKEKDCGQVISDTWEGNNLSINAHKQIGFFVSGIMFSKKL